MKLLKLSLVSFFLILFIFSDINAKPAIAHTIRFTYGTTIMGIPFSFKITAVIYDSDGDGILDHWVVFSNGDYIKDGKFIIIRNPSDTTDFIIPDNLIGSNYQELQCQNNQKGFSFELFSPDTIKVAYFSVACESDTGNYIPTPQVQNFSKIENLNEIKQNIVVFPNPAKDIINLSLKALSISDIEAIDIYNANGIFIQHLINYAIQNCSFDCFSYNLSFLPSGTYYLKVQFRNNTTIYEKFILSK
jgi:hypothetical protein